MRETINPNTMNYDQQITLEQALDLQNKIKAGEMPDISAYSTNSKILVSIGFNPIIEYVYNKLGCHFLLTRPDYATYIQGNKPVPKGYGYPSKELSSGIYGKLPEYYRLLQIGDLNRVNGLHFKLQDITNWWEVCFPLTDLARVEAEPERTEINAAQKEYIWKQQYPFAPELIDGKYFIDAVDYKNLPDEFKALAEPKPIMPAHFTYQNDEWLRDANKLAVEHEELKSKYEAQASEIAKYLEMGTENASLKLQLQEATASADSLQDRLTDAQNCIAAMEAKYNEIVKAANFAIDRLQIEQKMFGSYADAKCKSEIAVYKFDSLLNN